jgi:hypothetical protein
MIREIKLAIQQYTKKFEFFNDFDRVVQIKCRWKLRTVSTDARYYHSFGLQPVDFHFVVVTPYKKSINRVFEIIDCLW